MSQPANRYACNPPHRNRATATDSRGPIASVKNHGFVQTSLTLIHPMRRAARPALASERRHRPGSMIVAGQASTHLYNPDHPYALGSVMLRKDFVIAVMSLSAMMAAIFGLGCTGGSGSQQVESMVSAGGAG